MSSSFIPKGQEGLLLRDPLTFGFSAPSGAKNYKPIYSKQHDQSHKLSSNDRDVLHSGSIPKKIGFYTRHNPHPVRVRHIKGLNDAPICYIEDNTEPRYLMSPPSGQDFTGRQYCPPGSTRFSARGDVPPAVGVVPITYAWRDELEKKTNSAINRALGQPPSSRGGAGSRGIAGQFDQIDDSQLLDLLCRILQTDSIPACQAWLRAASDSEKTIVLNMIRMAASGDFAADSARSRPRTSDSDVRYIWAPEKSQPKLNSKFSHDSYLDDGDFSFQGYKAENEQQAAGLYDVSDNQPFKLPENDTVIKTARQLSNLASRQGSRCGTASAMVRMLSKEPPSPSRAAQLAMAENLSKDTSEQLQSYLKKQSREKRIRSATLSGPTPTRPNLRRPRSRSATPGTGTSYPPPPVMVTVSREKLRGSKNAGTKQTAVKLQYTSHWGSQ